MTDQELLETDPLRPSAPKAGTGANGESSWVEQPETSDDAVRDATGRGWDEWCTIIDEWPERTEGHAAMAARMGREQLDNQWWAQAVIVGYERIRGLRPKYGRADGTFAGSASKSLSAKVGGRPDTDRVERLHSDLLDASYQAEVISGSFRHPAKPVAAGLRVELRSKPTSKAVRWAINPDQGCPQFSIEARPDGRVRVAIQHQQLLSPEAVDSWKEFWSDWLASLDESG